MKFKMTQRRKRAQQKFNKDEIHIIKKGVKINNYEMIQAGRADTELYPTLEKYGCIKQEHLDVNKGNEIYGDLTEIKGLRSAMEQQKKAEELWQRLPLETRKDFGHNKYEFIDNGIDYIQRKRQEHLEAVKKAENKVKEREVENA